MYTTVASLLIQADDASQVEDDEQSEILQWIGRVMFVRNDIKNT
jgi:hypothetical protein